MDKYYRDINQLTKTNSIGNTVHPQQVTPSPKGQEGEEMNESKKKSL